MLYLRDIKVDIQMQCRNCGHEKLLARSDLERRFGHNYPVLSIASQYRCSRCASKNIESRPGAPRQAPEPAFEEQDSSQQGMANAIKALQGLLQSVRGPSPDDDFTPHDPMEDAAAFKTPAKKPPVEKTKFHLSTAALHSLAKEEEKEEGGVEEGIEVGQEEDEEEDANIPFFAIRDPDFRRNAEREPLDFDFDTDFDFDSTPDPLPVPEERDFRSKPAQSQPEPQPRPQTKPPSRPEPEPEPPRKRSAPPGSLDESLAVLRTLVEKAAAEYPEPVRRKNARSQAEARESNKKAKPAIESARENERVDDEEKPPIYTEQERSLEEALAQLRGILDSNDAEANESPARPRQR